MSTLSCCYVSEWEVQHGKHARRVSKRNLEEVDGGRSGGAGEEADEVDIIHTSIFYWSTHSFTLKQFMMPEYKEPLILHILMYSPSFTISASHFSLPSQPSSPPESSPPSQQRSDEDQRVLAIIQQPNINRAMLSAPYALDASARAALVFSMHELAMED
ncbi:uncharacterized protein V6R79_010050 [Siganus canaliculatus]